MSSAFYAGSMPLEACSRSAQLNQHRTGAAIGCAGLD